MDKKKNKVLFLCVGNSARSQMAEGILRKLAPDRFDVYSAGLEPKPIHPLTIRVMSELGLDISGQRAKGIDEVLGKISFTYVIFVCQESESRCPSVYPFTLHKLVWPIEDPAAFEGTELEKLEKFRAIRDEIKTKIESWLKYLDLRVNRQI